MRAAPESYVMNQVALLNAIETLRQEGKTDAANALLVLAEKTYSRSRRHDP